MTVKDTVLPSMILEQSHHVLFKNKEFVLEIDIACCTAFDIAISTLSELFRNCPHTHTEFTIKHTLYVDNPSEKVCGSSSVAKKLSHANCPLVCNMFVTC